MSRRIKILVVAMATVLALSAVGGVALAQNATDTADTSTEQATTQDTFVERLAEKLDVEVDELETAIGKVRQEMREEALQDRLDKAVEAGQLTEEEAQSIQEWRENRPSALEGSGPLGLGKQFAHRGHGGHGPAADGFGGPCGAGFRGF
ncbi:MAG: hypothetical protein ACLFVK_02335 [Dehalococcoidia bacterium]